MTSYPTSHRAQVPGLIEDYFKRCHADVTEHPIITGHYRDGRWRRQNYSKRVSGAWLRKLKAEGVTAVQVTAGGYSPEFQIDEVLRYANRKLLGGRLI